MRNNILILVALSLCVLMMSCNKDSEKKDNAEIFTGARYVRTEAVRVGNIERVLTYSGYVKYDQAINIIPNLSGKIEKIYVQEGQNVYEGQLLARIDKNSLEQYEANFNLAERNYQRSQNLLTDGVIDLKSYEDTENFWIAAKTAVEFARDNLEIRAPFSGVISAVNFKESETYSPLNPQGLFRIISNHSVYVEVNVSDNDVKALKLNDRARVIHNSALFEGYISFISPENDRMTGLNRIKIEFRNFPQGLRNNQFVNIEFIPEFKNNVLLIPKTALITEGRVILNRNGRSEYRTIVTGMENRTHIEIMEGLHEGELVIVEGNSGLEDNYPVVEFSG